MKIKPLNPDKIVDIPLKTWSAIGDNACNVVREQIREKRALTGKYSKSYATAKSSRKASQSQSSTETGFVNLTLTGKMLDNLKVRNKSKNSVTIGLIGSYAKRVQELQRIGFKKGSDWYIFNKRITRAITADTTQRIDKQFAKNIKIATKKPITFSIGK
tara:strand:+ start:129 stop:605 length:477 start_codon:yes stop_codon:yes gene_type:complete